MLSFDTIMDVVADNGAGTIVRRCIPSSIKEAEVAAKTHPDVEMEIIETTNWGACVCIKPKHYKGSNMDALVAAGGKPKPKKGGAV